MIGVNQMNGRPSSISSKSEGISAFFSGLLFSENNNFALPKISPLTPCCLSSLLTDCVIIPLLPYLSSLSSKNNTASRYLPFLPLNSLALSILVTSIFNAIVFFIIGLIFRLMVKQEFPKKVGTSPLIVQSYHHL